jgi:hypothetical protein
MPHSVFSLLRWTMPIGVGIAAARRAARLSASTVLSPAQLFPYVKAVAKSADVRPPGPSAVAAPSGAVDNLTRWWNSTTSAARLWRFQHTGSTPHTLTSVTARVRDTGYKTHSVLTEVKWGRLDGTSITPEIQIVTETGATLNLPLSLDYVHSKYQVAGGWVGENELDFHPLEAYLDHGLVIAFAYEIGGGSVRPYVPSTTDPSEAALTDYLSSGAGAADAESDRWYSKMYDGDFMAGTNPTMTTTGGTRGVTVFPPRVVVAVSIATTRERADFEPGGIVGMARFYPHVMVRANVRLKRIDTAMKATRPTSTTTLDTGNGTVSGTCCNAYSDIKSILVADSNEDPWGPNDAFKPFWSGVFSYYEIDPEVRLGGTRLHMVRRDRPSTRTEPKCGYRDLATSPETVTSIEKRPRQGEFDNLHIAPRLRLDASFVTYRAAIAWPPGSKQFDSITASDMRLDQIAMAPFCSHDCLHMHWRWSPGGARWIKGWGSGVSPYAEEAVPMIPTNHDLDVIMNGPNAITAVEQAFPTSTPGEDSTRTMRADYFQIFFYPGMAYAQGIVTWRESVTSSMTVTMANARSGFTSWDFADSGRNIMGLDQPPVLYWNLRYYAAQSGTTWRARPWIGSYSAHTSDITTGEVDRARDR